MQETIITDEQREELNKVLDELKNVYMNLAEQFDDKAKVRAMRKKLAYETHLISFVPFVKKALDENISTDMLTKFFINFYDVADGASISSIYNDTVKGGSAKAVNIARRNEELLAAWDEFFKTDEEETETE
jgi:hypothetical protein